MIFRESAISKSSFSVSTLKCLWRTALRWVQSIRICLTTNWSACPCRRKAGGTTECKRIYRFWQQVARVDADQRSDVDDGGHQKNAESRLSSTLWRRVLRSTLFAVLQRPSRQVWPLRVRRQRDQDLSGRLDWQLLRRPYVHLSFFFITFSSVSSLSLLNIVILLTEREY